MALAGSGKAIAPISRDEIAIVGIVIFERGGAACALRSNGILRRIAAQCGPKPTFHDGLRCEWTTSQMRYDLTSGRGAIPILRIVLVRVVVATMAFVPTQDFEVDFVEHGTQQFIMHH